MKESIIHNSPKIKYLKEKLESASKVTPYRPGNVANDTSFEAETKQIAISNELSDKLISVSKEKDINIYKLFMAGLAITLSKYTVFEEITISTSSFNLKEVAYSEVSTLLFFKLSLDKENTVKELLGNIHKELTENLGQQDYDYYKFREELLASTEAYNTFTGVGLFYEGLNCWVAELQKINTLFKIKRQGNKLSMELDYNPALYTAAEMDFFANHVLKTTELLIADFSGKLKDINPITQADESVLLHSFNQTNIEFDNTPVIDQFEAQVLKTPDYIAVKSGNTQLTYKELNERANKLAHYLLENCNLQPHDRVALMVNRSEHILIGILGTLKAGGVFIPVDITSPQERIEYQLNDGNCKAVITENSYISENKKQTEHLLVSVANNYATKSTNPGNQLKTNDVAYIVYTSGTTGRPKGALITNNSLANNVYWFKSTFELTSKDSTMLINSYNFDGCYGFLWAILVAGGTLHIPNDTIFDPDATLDYIKNEQITFLKLVPSTFGILVNSETFQKDPACCASIRMLQQGGEKINPKHLKKYLNIYPEAKLGNHYGPTECTIGAVAHWITSENINDFSIQPVLGKPYNNQRVYILSESQALLPVGVLGELCISGAGVSKGYLNNEILTAEKFIECPFEEGNLMYRTGDKARWLPNGTIEFLGRIDNQVKIRGYRVELDEISETVKEFSAVRDAITLLLETNQQTSLALWFTADTALQRKQLADFLKTRLPEYMLPDQYVQIDYIPLTLNGKIDKKQLPDPAKHQLLDKREIIAPKNPTEFAIQQIWKELLGIPEISTRDNFFEIGGHSLIATQMLARMHKNLAVKIPLTEVFIKPTIEELSGYVLAHLDDKSQFTEIQKAPVQEYYPLSHAQKRMWLTHQIQGDKTVYNIPHAIRIQSDLDFNLLEQALQLLVNRHESLRTVFRLVNGEPRQKVISPEINSFKLTYLEVQKHSNPETAANEIATEEAAIEFDLDAKPPLAATLIKLAEKDFVFLFTLHHIISDGWSTQVFTRELIQNYTALKNNDSEALLPPLKIHYKDFAIWQNEQFENSTNNKQQQYWQQKFEGEIIPLELPTDFKRTHERNYKGAHKSITFNQELYNSLKTTASESGITLFILLMTYVKMLLNRYTGQNDIIVGTPIAGREHADLSDQIGFYVNTLAIRSQISASNGLTDILEEVKKNLLEAFKHQDYPFNQLLDDLNIKPENGRTPLFDVMVVVQNEEEEGLLAEINEDLVVSEFDSGNQTSKYDLTFSFREEKSSLSLTVEYSTELFLEDKIERMLHHFSNLIAATIQNPDKKLKEVTYLSEEEITAISKFNGDATPNQVYESITERFINQVHLFGDRTALVDATQSYTYNEVHQKAIKHALYLRQSGIKPGEVVGLVCHRNADFVINMLAILKVGAVYLPLEEKMPEGRMQTLLEITNAKAVIADTRVLSNHQDHTVISILTSDLDTSRSNSTETLPDILETNSGDSLAYIMFTSGTTGKPKGVMVLHKNVVRLIKSPNYTSLSHEDKILQTGSLSFDAATFEIWGALLNGGEIHLTTLHELLDVKTLKQHIVQKQITRMWFTSSWFNQLVDLDPTIFKSLKQVLVGGEKLSSAHIKKVKVACPNLVITNGYGPTENTTFSICGDVLDGDLDHIKLGYPITGSTVHILDENLLPVPVGITGELYLGGAGVSKGYINDAELTRQKFIQSPVNTQEILYKSGDLGRWNEDGRVLFYGRTDAQVKIRGHRIEPSEIQNTLLKHPFVKEALVLIIENNKNEKVIVSYYTVSTTVTPEEISEYLNNKLPGYMIPEYYVLLETIPLNKNGKVDRKNLPLPDFTKVNTDAIVLPDNETQEILRNCFATVLNLEAANISVTASFFDLGGHSLKALRLLSSIEQEFQTTISISQVFTHPTVKALAAVIEASETESKTVLTEIPENLEYYPVTPVQHRLYAIHQINPDSLAYNIPGMLELPLQYSEAQISKACNKLIERHEILRTCFFMKDQEVWQKVVPFKQIELEIITNTDVENAIKKFTRPFSLAHAPLVRLGLLKTDTCHILLMDFHHIVVDGLSQAVLIDELFSLLNSKTLEEVTFQFKHFAWWKNQPAQLEELHKQENYWLERYSNPLPKLELPTDYNRPKVKNYKGGTVQFVISEENKQFLRALGKAQNTTLYMNLMAVWSLLLAKMSSVEDLAVGTPVTGRTLPELTGMVGMFVNTLAVRLFPKQELSFAEYLKITKDNILKDWEHQEYPLDELIEKTGIERNTSENPIFNTMFSLLTKEEFNLEIDLNTNEPVFSKKLTGVKFDLNFKVADLDDQIICNLDYSSDLFSEGTIRSLVERFNRLLEQLKTQPETTIKSLTLLSKEEENRIAQINNTRVEPEGIVKTVDQLFDEVALKYPEKTGYADTQGTYTLKEAKNKASALAKAIVEKCSAENPNPFIGIMLPAQKEIAIAILGVFKAGAAYVPIDTDLPKERIQHIIKDSGITQLISTKEIYQSLNFSGELLDIDEIMNSKNCHDDFISQNHPEHLAYIIYTSGSTGKPKGVPIKQKQLINYINWFTKNLNYSHKNSSLLVSSYAYDLGHSSIFPAMANGGALHILKKEEYLSVECLGNYIREHKITYIKMTPTLFNVFINDANFQKDYLSSMKQLMLGGEAIIAKDVEKFFDIYPDNCFINHYGPTETTIGCIAKILTLKDWKKFKEQPVIGRPINNMQVYVLDNQLAPVPTGAIGQIYLAGTGVSAGYLNRPELTKEKFIENPFKKGEKMYATGDLGCWNSNYEVVFKGRADHQVKIRGYRVELDEIAAVLRNMEGVTNTAVITMGELDDTMIVAYVETQKEVTQLYDSLEKLLPVYMIPSVLIPVDEIPMTPNGKTDLKALKAIPIPNQFSKDAVAPETAMEKQLLELWENILNIPINNVKADFFKLGGHSLRALKVVNYIEQNWHLKVPLKMFFENPTVKGLAAKLEGLEKSVYKAIEKVEPQENYPLSHAQQRLWLLNELSENQVAYNIPRVFRLKGTLKEAVINQVFDDIIKRHEILRTVFRQVAGVPRQVILEPENFKGYYTCKDITQYNSHETMKLVSELVNHRFNLENGPLIKVALLKESENTHILLINLHHIISDGWSAGILLQELCEGYNNRLANMPVFTEALPIQYKDFTAWQNKKLENTEYLKKQRDFWKAKLSGELSRCTLPESFPRNSGQKTTGKTVTHIMGSQLAEKLEQLAVEQNASLYMVLLSALNVLLYRYTGQEDIIIGTVISGREREELNNQIGFYVNTLVQRTHLKAKETFVEVLQNVKNDVLATTEYQYYPFDLLVSDLGIVKEEGRSQLFDIMFVHQNNEEAEEYQLNLNGIEVAEAGEDLNESKFDVSFVTRKTDENLQVFVEYNANIYSEQFLKEFLFNFENLLNELLVQKQQQIKKVTYLSESFHNLLSGYNNTNIPKVYTSIQAHFEKSVAEGSENHAIISSEGYLTYQQLNEKVNQMAWWLRDTLSNTNNQLIAFSIERSEWQLICMLAILKSGAGFLPIDTSQPTKRKEFILKDAAPLLLITDKEKAKTESLVPTETIAGIKNKITKYPKSNPETINQPEDLAYAIYTSGSTGTPKGVMISHQGNINMVTDQVKRFEITPTDRCLQFASVSFDASVYEIFIALYAGASIVLLTNEIIADPKVFEAYLNEKQVTFATLPPVYLSRLNKKALTTLKVLVTAGEAPNLKDAQVLSKHLNYFNAYGPTEYSVCASVYKIKGNEKVIPIGSPLENTAMYVLDTHMNILPAGCWGELYLAGKGMALGYINRPDENEKRFIQNPYTTDTKLYKTGDIARWNAEGYIEFKGRKDDMLKIRGYRIEISEIEHAVLESKHIDEVVVTFDSARQVLIAYAIANTHISEIELKTFLKERLPAYMIPSICCFLETIPLTTNGKVDYKILSQLAKNAVESREIIQPENEKEKNIRSIWARLLNKDENFISTSDNFFDYGGHSVLAMKLTGKIWETYQKDISIRDFLKNPTIKGLAALVASNTKDKGLLVSLNKVEEKQKELFMIPPVLGSSSVFRELAWHFEKQNIACYGVQYRGFDYDDAFDKSIEQMALSAIKEIKILLKPQQQVFIAGYSMGALIAAEITSKLEAEGFKVNLILIDKVLEDNMSELQQANNKENQDKLLDYLLKGHMQGVKIPNHHLTRIKGLLKHNIALLENYRFNKQLNADILAIAAKESSKKQKMNNWKKVTNGTLFSSESAGNHFTIINEVNSYELFKNINRFINRNTNKIN